MLSLITHNISLSSYFRLAADETLRTQTNHPQFYVCCQNDWPKKASWNEIFSKPNLQLKISVKILLQLLYLCLLSTAISAHHGHKVVCSLFAAVLFVSLCCWYVSVSTFISEPTVFQQNVGIWWLKCGLYSNFLHTSTHTMLWYISVLYWF